MYDLQCAKRANLGAYTAARAVLFYRKIRVDQFKGSFRAD